jgi:hypothetical protein
MEKLEHTFIKEITLWPNADSNIDDCLREAIKISITEWQIVNLMFNEKVYNINPLSLIACIKQKRKL